MAKVLLLELYEPVPAEFVAATLKTYEEPEARPVIVAVVLVLVPSLNVVQDEPLLLLY
jgi:hypothetical protein